MKTVFFYILTYAKVISQNIRQLISIEPKKKYLGILHAFTATSNMMIGHCCPFHNATIHSTEQCRAKFETSIIQWPENEHKQENVVEMLQRHPLWGIGVWSINKIASLNDDNGCSGVGGVGGGGGDVHVWDSHRI